ncbi:collagenase 3 [Electrophorus electricus]|uniref:collagenase 3 n=1 Tax=Electrophorus electricus TaxID=8005 RepID=UPI0015CFBA36|nr:collagenase 3 [Electrophorus electricus]
MAFAEGYLETFYGFRPVLGRPRWLAAFGSKGFTAKVKEMQRFFGLATSGELDQQTLAAMTRGRCGLSDTEQFGETTRWRTRTLSYRISSYSSQMKPPQIRKVFRAAWRIWARATPLKFKRTSTEADIVISFNIKDHDDGSPFDGPGGTLGHAFLPGPGLGGDVHLDAEENWTSSTTGYNLFAVAVHEFGHALGLAHSSDPGAVMFPTYQFDPHTDLQLSFQDVQDIQTLYGKSPIKPGKPPPKTPDKCDPELSFDAVTGFQEELIFFKDRFMWRAHPTFEEIKTTLIRSLWSDMPTYIDAAYENNGTIVIFKGSQYWEVKGLDMKDGFPRDISDFDFPLKIRSIDAALHFRESQFTVFFTGEECWRYDEKQKQMIDGYPQMIMHEWPAVPSPVDTAVAYGGLVYFFIGNRQLEFDPKLQHITNKMPANAWLRCGGQRTMINMAIANNS